MAEDAAHKDERERARVANLLGTDASLTTQDGALVQHDRLRGGIASLRSIQDVGAEPATVR